ncbi:MAG: hypothetical protein MUC96_10055 [Myxococcaceae bacterium]|jgi:hypothetical protein|nr:hypothetical protein [Myxococcaceae bacterium]
MRPVFDRVGGDASMHVQVLVSQLESSPGLREWVAGRLQEGLGAAVVGVLSVAVVMNPVASTRRPERLVRCSVVVTTTEGRRVVETRDEKPEAALERAMRLVSLSLFADAPAAATGQKPPPLS